MLIDTFAPEPDEVETHRLIIAAPCAQVYQALRQTDFGKSLIVKGLLALRGLPARLARPGGPSAPMPARMTLLTMLEKPAAGFGQLAETPGRELVLGIMGRFWQPTGNTMPFQRGNFNGPVPAGLARAVWNFTVQETDAGQTLLTTETRIVCGDDASRRKFRAYWLFVQPFSGLLRRLMLRAVRRECETKG